jgi:group I intron endonuclease
MNTNIGVYEIRNKLNGHRYVGSTIDYTERIQIHKHQLEEGTHHCTYLQNAWNKYGEDAFKFSLLIMAPRKMIRKIEQMFLDNPDLYKYNISKRAIGGRKKGFHHTRETRMKMSMIAKEKGRIPPGTKGMKKTPSQLKRMSEASKGRKKSNEEIEKIRQATIDRWANGELGTPEILRKIALANRGKTNAKLNEDKIRRIRTMNEQGMTQKEIADVFSISPSNISRILSGVSWGWVDGGVS